FFENPKVDMLSMKLAAEVLPLLTDEAFRHGVVAALGRGSPWVAETAMRSCRHLARLDTETIRAVFRYTRTIPTWKLFDQLSDLDFSLSLSESLKLARRGLWLDVGSLLAMWILAVALLAFGHPALRVIAIEILIAASILEVSPRILQSLLDFLTLFDTNKLI